MTLIVLCPKCGNTQKTAPRVVMNSIKRCVYCGRSFVIHSARKDRILRQA